MDETEERVEGPTPAGGAYAIAYFLDAGGDPIRREDAVAVEIVEYAVDGSAIRRTYGTIGRQKASSEDQDEDQEQ